MKAAVCKAYGGPDVVQLLDVPDPVAKPDEVLIRVVATTVSSGDARVRGARFPSGFSLLARVFLGLTGPRNQILGTELSGVVEAVGANVTRYRPGDQVFAFSGAGMGCHAELKAMPEDGVMALVPVGVTFEEAAAISFGATTALHFLRDVGKVQRGERVLVNGASGAVGSAAVQLARHFGAHVTGVCSAANANLARALGADAVIDYKAADFARSGTRWDIILDTVGNVSFVRCRNALNKNGRLLLAVGELGDLLKAPFQSMTSGLKVAGGPAPERAEDIIELKRLCETGAYKPVIDSRFAFDRISEAHARVDSERKVGSVVVTMRDVR
ncbi:NAD(P)-dependent alcohol dehydrogenase [Hyphomicrobium sp. LHD-15]|uniref:NAD(P)-dependent alcohol dehydrogenase n=1 Tax=Hyphomicrobium sp. LHD-15 TaxID=3072142 RepID=UPI00280D80A5|nr:NAD(P)-dependent alcohol dehydrogenase [Hyphomicrobium sp. LHD-15]MDQ8698561.1 NAD(P)-dependent alcohol dehydrogenase [Hyphomicrobium sp. LHD-15]